MLHRGLPLLAAVTAAFGSVVGPPNSWNSYTLNIIDSYVRTGDPQDIGFSGSKVGTSEFLILTSSHGNPGDVTKKQARTNGGGWTQLAYAGNDDKAIEMWFRQVTAANQNDLGQIDTNSAKAKLAVVVYAGILKPGSVDTEKVLKSATIEIDGHGSAPWLVVAASDNGGSRGDQAKEFYGTSDDKTWIYLTDDKTFKDSSASKIRGAIAMIELGDSSTPTPTPPPPPTPTPTPPPSSTDTLPAGSALHPGDHLVSAGGRATLAMQSADGNLVLYDATSAVVWSSGTAGHPGAYLVLQASGPKLLLRDSDETVLWDTGKIAGATKLVLQDDCDLALLDDSGNALWSLGTSCTATVEV